jgi:hypothetical protein
MLSATNPAPGPESAGPAGQTSSTTASLTGPPTRPSWVEAAQRGRDTNESKVRKPRRRQAMA